MRRKLTIGMVAAGTVVAGVTWAGIPEPDFVLYGQVFVNQLLQGAGEDLTVLARVDGVAEPVARYSLGQDERLGDRYALRVRLESLADGSAPSDAAAVVGKTAHLLIKQGEGAEQLVTDYVIAERGGIAYVDLGARVRGDWTGDAVVNVSDLPNFTDCLHGPFPTSGQCVAVYDFDNNSTVDLADYGGYQAAVAGK